MTTQKDIPIERHFVAYLESELLPPNLDSHPNAEAIKQAFTCTVAEVNRPGDQLRSGYTGGGLMHGLETRLKVLGAAVSHPSPASENVATDIVHSFLGALPTMVENERAEIFGSFRDQDSEPSASDGISADERKLVDGIEEVIGKMSPIDEVQGAALNERIDSAVTLMARQGDMLAGGEITPELHEEVQGLVRSLLGQDLKNDATTCNNYTKHFYGKVSDAHEESGEAHCKEDRGSPSR